MIFLLKYPPLKNPKHSLELLDIYSQNGKRPVLTIGLMFAQSRVKNIRACQCSHHLRGTIRGAFFSDYWLVFSPELKTSIFFLTGNNILKQTTSARANSAVNTHLPHVSFSPSRNSAQLQEFGEVVTLASHSGEFSTGVMLTTRVVLGD